MAEPIAGNGAAPPDEELIFRAFASVADSILTSRLDFARRHGFQYDGNRDLYSALGYDRRITLPAMRERYCRGGIAKRIVDAKPQATWREPPEVFENPDTQRDTRFERDWKALAEGRDLFEYLERVDKLAGIGRYAILLLGIQDGRDLERPAGRAGGPDGLLYLHAYSEEHATIEALVEDPRDPRFGLPLLYRISIGADATGKAGRRQQRKELVHWTRVVHVAEGLLENDVYGTPRLEAPWNLLDDLFKVVGASGEMFWRGGYQGFQAAIDPEAVLNEDDKAALSENWAKYVHGLDRLVKTRNVDLKPLETRVSDPRGAFHVVAACLAGVTEIPLRILFGSERGELASTQDRHNWNERIAERQRFFAERRILRSTIDRFQDLGVLPMLARNREITVQWPDLLALPETERSQNAARYGQAISAFESARSAARKAGQEPIVTAMEFREHMLDLPPEPPEGSRDPDPDPGPEPDPEPPDPGGE